MGASSFNGGGVDGGFGVRETLLGSESSMDEVMITRSCCPHPPSVSTRVTFNHFLCPDSTIWNSNRSDQAAFCGLIGPFTLSKPWFRAQLMSTQSSFDRLLPTNSSQLAEPGLPLAWLMLSTLA